MTVHISDRDALVLHYIAENGPTYGYSLGELEGFTTRRAYAALKSLESRGYLKVGRIVKDRPGRDKKYYSLTVLGFSHALRLTYFDLTEAVGPLIKQEKDLREDFSSLMEAAHQVLSPLQNIIGQWGDLIPLVLGKWRHFVETGFLFQANIRLNVSTLNQVLREGWPRSWTVLYPSSDPVDVFTYDFYQPLLWLENRTDRLRWSAACAGDSEIRDYLIKRVKRSIKLHESLAREGENQLEVVEAEDPSAMAEALEGKTEEVYVEMSARKAKGAS